MICQCLADQLFASADLLATDKSRYFAQSRTIIVNYTSDTSTLIWTVDKQIQQHPHYRGVHIIELGIALSFIPLGLMELTVIETLMLWFILSLV